MDYSFERHQNCPYFFQNSWLMSENKYICERNKENEDILFLDEIPLNCIKGFKEFHYPEMSKILEDKKFSKKTPKAKIYQFKRGKQ